MGKSRERDKGREGDGYGKDGREKERGEGKKGYL